MKVKLGILSGMSSTKIPELVVEKRCSMDTEYGAPSADLVEGQLNGCDVVCLARHGENHRIPAHKVNYRANISALQARNVSHIISINTVGGIGEGLVSG
mgnify:CR=1 FL=1